MSLFRERLLAWVLALVLIYLGRHPGV